MKKEQKVNSVRSDNKLCDNVDFLKKVIKTQARLLVSYRIGDKPPEWVFDTIGKAKIAGIEC